MKISAFVITLERAVARRAHTQWIIDNAPLPCVRLGAVDGSALTHQAVADVYQRQLLRPRYPHTLRRGEIGCFLSHRLAWQAIVDRSLEAGLVLEDDVTFQPGELLRAVEFVATQMVPGDYIQFQSRDISRPTRDKNSRSSLWRSNEPATLVRPRPVPLRTTAQLVTYDAAQRLLVKTQCFDRPVDALLQMTWVTGVPVRVALPRVISEISQNLGGSTLGGSEKPWRERLRREILRPIYRAQIQWLSRRAS